jgi:hypothetical protein
LRRASCQTLGLAVLALAAAGSTGVAVAQTATPAEVPASAPPRYLNWAGRGEVTAVPRPIDVSAQPMAQQRRPNRVIPHGGAYQAPPTAPTIASEAPRPRLTPANAWLHAPAPAPIPMAAAPAPQPAPPAPPPRAVPEFLPDQGGRGQPVPADIAFAASQPAPAVAGQSDDPMAPRRDAPIFRMQQTPPPPVSAQPAPSPQEQGQAAPIAPEPRRVALVAANPADRPAEQGARYYSVHRQNGREPDPLTLPQPTYVDALAITTPVTLASQDLAQPEQAPTLIRDAQGRVRAQPTAPEGDYQ